MPTKTLPAVFSSRILEAEDGGFRFATVPPELSASHLRRGRVTAHVSIGRSGFDALMEPDGALGHWFVMPSDVLTHEGLALRVPVSFTLSCLPHQPEPALPADFDALLRQHPAARDTWERATTLARIDWVHWMVSAKQAATRRERAASAIDMLETGKTRVCCFDPSGVYSKALSRPVEKPE